MICHLLIIRQTVAVGEFQCGFGILFRFGFVLLLFQRILCEEQIHIRALHDVAIAFSDGLRPRMKFEYPPKLFARIG
jgi:hypothetical protein